MQTTRAPLRALLGTAALMLMTTTALADGPERVRPVTDPVVRAECGSCHMAFQPELLPAESWKKVMAQLADHFGEDASLPADQVAAIEAVLVAQAGRARKDEAPLRITELRWWRHEHDARHVELERWTAPDVLSRVNCVACHPRAERGDYDEG